ncbi:MAG: hypothetical protein ABII06_20245 [Pseudomonadota bacterium]
MTEKLRTAPRSELQTGKPQLTQEEIHARKRFPNTYPEKNENEHPARKEKKNPSFEAWVSCKRAFLGTVSNGLKGLIERENLHDKLPQYKWQKSEEQASRKWEKDFRMYEEKFDEYLKTGIFMQTGAPDHLGIIKDHQKYFANVLLRYCDFIENIIKNHSSAKDKNDFLITVEYDLAHFWSEVYIWQGYNQLILEQKFSKSNSGVGQIEAREKRLASLVESLKKYDTGKEIIIIKKNTFRGFVNKTFEGKENYPRHHSVFKSYLEEAEKILSKQIILTNR